MRKMICGAVAAAATIVATTGEARAAGQWGLYSGDTLNGGQSMVYGEVGWPDLSLGYQYGLSNNMDIGARFQLTYGFLGTTATAVGIALSAPIRFNLSKSDKLSVLLHVDPGVKFAAFSPVFFGLMFPVGVQLGVHLTREATLEFGFDMPFYLNFTNTVYFVIPPQAGPGFQYTINNNMAVGINTRFGAAIGVGGAGYSGAAFAFLTQAGFGYSF